jgi:hypothetical protein
VPFRRGWSAETRFCVIVFGAALLVHLYCAFVGWNNTLLGPHSFRQAQTAITTDYFLREGVQLSYVTPILGPPWEMPLEFPLFQACTAWLVQATGLDLDVGGRLMSWLFFVSMLPACFLLLGRFGVSPGHRLVFLALLLLSPLYVFFSRSFMIESAALSLAAWFLLCFERYLSRPHVGWLLGALAFGGLAGSVKITTFAIFLVAALLILFSRLRSTPGTWRQWWIRSAAVVAGPIILSTLWLVYATSVRHRNPEAAFLDDHFGFWSFGDVAQRLSPRFWGRTFRIWTGDIASEAGIVLLVLYYGLLGGRYRRAVTGCILTFLSGQLIFSNLYFVHAYYFYANGLFLLAALGFVLAELLRHSAFTVANRWILVVLVLGLQVSAYWRTYLDFQRKNLPIPEAVAVLNSITEPEDIVVIVGQDWDASYAYYAERRAFMVPSWRTFEPEGIRQTIERFDPDRVAAILIDGALWRDAEFVQKAFESLEPESAPFITIQDLGIWVPKRHQMSVRDRFDPRRFPRFDIAARSNEPGQLRTVLAREIRRRDAFKQFNPRPIRATSSNEFTLAGVQGKEVLNAHTTTELVFRRSIVVRHISAEFGIEDGSYTGKEFTDGVEIVVFARRADGAETPLFRRLLDPKNAPADRGLQTLDIAVDLPPNTEIVFQTLPGPAGGISFDWSYFGAITLR